MACQAGIVDLDNLRDALSYFLQELLRFTLRGVLGWLTEEVAKSPCVTFLPKTTTLQLTFLTSQIVSRSSRHD